MFRKHKSNLEFFPIRLVTVKSEKKGLFREIISKKLEDLKKIARKVTRFAFSLFVYSNVF